MPVDENLLCFYRFLSFAMNKNPGIAAGVLRFRNRCIYCE